MGDFKYDHKQDGVLEACGVDTRDPDLGQKISNIIDVLNNFDKTSEVIEFLLDNYNDDNAIRLFMLRLILKGLDVVRKPPEADEE